MEEEQAGESSLGDFSCDNSPVSYPLTAYPVSLDDLLPGDHVLCLVQDAPYRRMYQSAVVVEKDKDTIKVIRNVEGGIVKANLTSSEVKLHRVQYSHGKYSPEKVVQRATERLNMREDRYDTLRNNSHQFATWSVSGRESNLNAVLLNLERNTAQSNECNGIPALFKKRLSFISELKPGDHVFTNSQNWLVESTDENKNTFSAYTYLKKRVQKQNVTFKDVDIILYDGVICDDLHGADQVLHDAKVACGDGLWDSDSTFASVIKVGISCTLTSSAGVTSTTVNPGDHVISSDTRTHYIAESVHAGKVFDGYTYDKSNHRVIKRTNLTWQDIVPYNVLRNPKDVLNDARMAYGLWKGDDEFATFLKTGNTISFSSSSLLDLDCIDEGFYDKAEKACKKCLLTHTRVTPDICVEEGDHLILKKGSEQDRHVIVCNADDNQSLIVTPSIHELCEKIMVADYEIYRINYKYSIPGQSVVKRAICEQGRRYFCDLSNPEVQCKLVTWAKIGKPRYLPELPPNQVIVEKCPYRYERVVSIGDINVGDHLFEPTPTYWFHYLVTKKDYTQFSIIYQLRTAVKEETYNIDVINKQVYKVIYPECFPAEKAIQRARSKFSSRSYDPEGRMKFVRRAKTGSDDGVFVDVLLNYNLPTSKSEINSFTQLNPGDYITYKEGTYWHHCLVHSITSPENCCIYEQWKWIPSVAEVELRWHKEVKYYRLNYNQRACLKVEQSLALAADCVKSNKRLGRQTFVQYAKTLDDTKIKVDPLMDDRIFLHRERVMSVSDLQIGDHIEMPASLVGMFVSGAQHHMFVSKKDGATCSVIHRNNKGLFDHFSTKEEDVMAIKGLLESFEEGKVFRIIYLEHIPTEIGLRKLQEVMSAAKDYYHILKNNCEHLVTLAMTGLPISIQVDEKLRQLLILSSDSPFIFAANLGRFASTGSGSAAIRLGITGIVAVAGGEDVAESAAVGTFQLGARAVMNSTAVGLATAGAVAFVVVALCEGVILCRDTYKLNRKKKFHKISEAEYKRAMIKNGSHAVAVVAGGVGGAIVGQLVIPVPVLGVVVGALSGTAAGIAAGYGAGHLISKSIADARKTDLPSVDVITVVDVDMD